jgi:hypothetical protein
MQRCSGLSRAQFVLTRPAPRRNSDNALHAPVGEFVSAFIVPDYAAIRKKKVINVAQ